jgi:hypothetical protein
MKLGFLKSWWLQESWTSYMVPQDSRNSPSKEEEPHDFHDLALKIT